MRSRWSRRELGRVAALGTAASAIGALPGPGGAARAAGNPIRIGLSITRTGPYSPPAIFELQGYQLALEELNKAGGLLGRPLQLVSYDDQGNPATAVQLYRKLITDDRVDLLVSPYETDLTAAIAPIVNRARMVMPCLAANIDVFGGKFPYLLQAMTQTGRYMTPVIDLAASRNYKTAALLVQDTQFPQELAKGVRAAAKDRGIRILFDESYAPNTTDFSALVLKLGAGKPDAIIGATYLADSEGIVRAAKAQNVNARMFAFSIGPVEPEFQSSLGPAAEGVFGTTLYFPSLKTQGNADFVRGFTAKFQRAPDYHAAVAYASLKLLADAVQKVGQLDQAKIRDQMLHNSVETVAGTFKLDKTGIQIGYGSYALQWQGGRQQLVWPADQQTAAPALPHAGW